MRQITDLFHEKKMNRVVLTGMGSSLYAMDTVLSYLTGHGIPALSYSSFELSRFQFGQLDGRTLVIAVSESGNSAEVIELVEKAKAVTTVVGIFNNESSKLAQLADIRLPIGGDKELSITSKTYELTMLILNILAGRSHRGVLGAGGAGRPVVLRLVRPLGGELQTPVRLRSGRGAV